AWIGGRQHDLPGELREVRHEVGVALRIQLTGDVVEEQQWSAALHTAEVLDLADLERQHDGPRLSLAGEQPRWTIAQRQRQVVCVRSDAGIAAFAIARQPAS